MFSHLGPVRRRTTTEEEERVNHPRPEDSVYYHPTLNPSGAPPPGKLPMFKSSIGPRIPLPEASASKELIAVRPPPPPIHQSFQPPPPGTFGSEKPGKSDDSATRSSNQFMLVVGREEMKWQRYNTGS